MSSIAPGGSAGGADAAAQVSVSDGPGLVTEMQASLESMGLLAAYDHVLSELVNRRTSVPPSHLFEFVAREFERFGTRWEGGMVSQKRAARDRQRRKRQMDVHMQLEAQQDKLRSAAAGLTLRQALGADSAVESEPKPERERPPQSELKDTPQPDSLKQAQPKLEEGEMPLQTENLPVSEPEESPQPEVEASQPEPKLIEKGKESFHNTADADASEPPNEVTDALPSMTPRQLQLKGLAVNIVENALETSMTPRGVNATVSPQQPPAYAASDAEFIMLVVRTVLGLSNAPFEDDEAQNDDSLETSSVLSEGSDLSLIPDSGYLSDRSGKLEMSLDGTTPGTDTITTLDQ